MKIIHKPTNLVNAKEMNSQYPDTFLIPSKKEINKIGIKSCVKISNGVERFWVTITLIMNDTIVGKINNDLIIDEGYDIDDLIEFKFENILEIDNS